MDFSLDKEKSFDKYVDDIIVRLHMVGEEVQDEINDLDLASAKQIDESIGKELDKIEKALPKIKVKPIFEYLTPDLIPKSFLNDFTKEFFISTIKLILEPVF